MVRSADALRVRVRADVLARTPVDDREAQSIELFVEHLDALDDPFSQEAGLVHITGSGVIVGRRGVVMLRHKRLGLWLQPGGHLDPSETPWDAARRESEEETGLAVEFAGPVGADGIPELLHVDVHEGGRGHLHLDLRYLLHAGDADPAPPEGESQEIGWFAWDEALEVAEGGLSGIIMFVRSNLRP